MATFVAAELQVSLESGSSTPGTGLLLPVTLERGFAAGGGGEPPVVTIIEPTPPALPSPGRSIIFDVLDVDGFATIVVMVEYGTGAYEVVHDGDAFGQVYAAQSTRSDVAGGFRYSVKRAGGWFGETVTLRIVAVDAEGNVG